MQRADASDLGVVPERAQALLGGRRALLGGRRALLGGRRALLGGRRAFAAGRDERAIEVRPAQPGRFCLLERSLPADQAQANRLEIVALGLDVRTSWSSNRRSTTLLSSWKGSKTT
jgi:hypothetical protein